MPAVWKDDGAIAAVATSRARAAGATVSEAIAMGTARGPTENASYGTGGVVVRWQTVNGGAVRAYG